MCSNFVSCKLENLEVVLSYSAVKGFCIYNLYLINQLKPIFTCFRIRLVPSDICLSI